ncbi:protocadherin-8-like isoform X2 [Pleurodeles waltl]|uniref:protocadherin-8-like isoform X2 n=1 Tax=Pleurodeles waltl TaxID=8319 RepID=UPI00370969FF
MVSSQTSLWSAAVAFQLLLLALAAPLSSADTSRYFTHEEDPPGSVIAVLSEDLIFNSADRPDSSFRLMKQINASLIRMRESDGQLSIGERIDREQVCGQAPHCTLALDVVSFSKEQFRLVHVEVEVRDINDNAPRFPRAEIPVEVSESVALGSRFPLDIAIDEDVGINSVQSYQISVNSHFSLEVQTRADGVKYADLVLVKELDRESQDTFTLDLVAKDGGSPALSGTAAVTVRVLDFNDHSPVFEHPLITVQLLEDAPVGSLLLALSAADPDEGVNGQVVYGFSPQVSSEVRELFKLDSRTGRLTLDGQVDFETKQSHEFDVQAQDLGATPLSATCKIIVHVTDVNDNAPSITVTPLTSITAGVAHITEAASRESFVALISTLDRDSGPNGQVHCSLYGHEHFRLQQAYEDSYMIVTTAALDREKISEYNLTIVAEDLGSPPFKTVRQFTIRVSDENDNPPFFAKPVYEVSVLENNAPGSYITTVVARDPDLGHNGKVTYTLMDTEVMGTPLFTFVTVDPASGSLYAVRPFDYESLKEIEVEIEARDEGLPQLSSRALIRIKIVDQNDNTPLITFPPLRNDSADILLPLGAPLHYLVVQLKATDEDEGVNSELSFVILQDKRSIFAINKVSGELYTTRRLEAEKVTEKLSVVIVVSDRGIRPLSSTATLNVILADTAPSSDQIVITQFTQVEKQRLDDVSVVLIGALSGGCVLILIAIIFVAATCRRGPRHFKQSPKESNGQKGENLLKNSSTSEADSCTDAETRSDSCQLSLSTESESCGDVSHTEESSKADKCYTVQRTPRAVSQDAVAAPFQPVSMWQEGKSVTCLSHTHPDQFSVKDSGRGDSDFNDSDSDLNAEASKRHCEKIVDQHTAYEQRRLYSNSGSICRYPPHQLQRSQPLPPQYENGYTIKYSYAPVYQHSPQLPNPTYQQQHFQAINSRTLHSFSERVMVASGPTMQPATLPRGREDHHHTQRFADSTATTEVATSF